MGCARLRLYAELNDFLPAGWGPRLELPFDGSPSVAELLASIGLPSAAVDLVLADGEPVELSSKIRDGARLSVYPVFECFDIGLLTRVRASPLRETRFLLARPLARLARLLRLAGFDVRQAEEAGPEELVRIAVRERRIVLTRDPGLFELPGLTHGYALQESDLGRQLAELVERLDLFRSIAPLGRCLRCATLLEPLPRAPAAGGTLRCGGCGRSYTPASRARAERLIASFLF